MVYVLNSGAPGYTFGAANQTFTIGKHDFYGSTTHIGIYTTHAGSKLVNSGVVGSDTSAGVYFALGAQQSKVTNTADGRIMGLFGILTTGADSTITNRGQVIAKQAGVYSSGAGTKLANHGTIEGDGQGVLYLSSGSVENAGLIEGGTYGFVMGSMTGATAKIVNQSAGTIAGPTAVHSYANATGKIVLDNRGTIDGKIVLDGSGSDKIVNKGTIKGKVDLGRGDDTFIFAGGKQGTVSGGNGADRFEFKSKLAPAKNAARIDDFKAGEDVIGLSKKLFDVGGKGTLKKKFFEAGSKANDADDRILYDKKTGQLFYDEDGKGGKAAVLFAKLDAGLNLTHKDFVVMG